MVSRRRQAFFLVVAALAVVVVIVLLRGRAEVKPLASTQEAAAPTERPSLPPPSGLPGVEVHTIKNADDKAAMAARLREQYEAYKAGSIYPDWSYPLTPDMEFLLAWNKTVTNDLPVGDEQNKIFFRFDASAGRVFPGQAYVSWAEAFVLENGQKKRLPFHFDKASVVLTGGPKQGDAFQLEYRDDGKDGDEVAGDFVYTNRFVPSERDELSQANSARIEVYVDIGGNKRRFLRDFVWAPRPVLEVVGIKDGIEEGSLVVSLDCEIFEDGVYTFYGNLFAADGVTPIATSKKNYPMKAGREQAKLVFFGKVLNDQQIDGPYVIKDFHGLKRKGDDEFNNVWWQHAAVHKTRGYASTDFSGDEWNDPERRERLANFERVIAEAEGRLAGP